MERVFQESFIHSHSHTTGQTRGTFEGGIYHHCSWSLPCCHNTAIGCNI